MYTVEGSGTTHRILKLQLAVHKNLYRHRYVGEEPDHEPECPTGLRQGHQVGHGVEEAGSHEDAEVPGGSEEAGPGQGVQESEDQKRGNVLHVVTVAPNRNKDNGKK